MGKVFLFMNVSLDGYVEDRNQDISAFSVRDEKFEAFQRDQGQGTGTVLLGRKTFEMMRNFWPTPMAQQMAPDVARFMNETPKVVVGHNNLDPNWQNTTVFYKDIARELAELKAASRDNIIVMGSNNLCVTLIQKGLLDEVQIVINPVLLGGGTPLFNGISEAPELVLKETISFESGKVLLAYEFEK